MKLFSKILVPTDFSDPARHALDRAVELAARFGASVTLFHVQVLPMSYAAESDMFGAEVVQALEAAARQELVKEKARAEQRAASLGLENAPAVATKLVLGVPVVAITDEAQRGGRDLIVIGSHGRTGIKRALIGSVAERVVRTSACPVLTVR